MPSSPHLVPLSTRAVQALTTSCSNRICSLTRGFGPFNAGILTDSPATVLVFGPGGPIYGMDGLPELRRGLRLPTAARPSTKCGAPPLFDARPSRLHGIDLCDRGTAHCTLAPTPCHASRRLSLLVVSEPSRSPCHAFVRP